ncbi:MAG: hypothetical protein ACMUIE_05550 [Thermoplasmatota archaeon]
MKDRIIRRSRYLTIPHVLEAIKERLVEFRFNIDLYDIKSGEIDSRRNSLDKIVIGLYRKAKIKVQQEKKGGEISIDITWGGLLFPFLLSGIWFFVVSLAVLKGMGAKGLLISTLIGLLGVSLNVLIFYVMRARFISRIKRDLHDLESYEREKNKKLKGMGGKRSGDLHP